MLREDLNNMPASGVTAGTYGSSSAIPAITVDAKGRVTSATTSAIDSTAITNGTSNVSVAASGDITVTRAGSTKATFNSAGIDVPGTLTANRLIVDDDGSSSPSAVFKADDGNPWAVSIKNDTYSTNEEVGLKVFQADAGNVNIANNGNGSFLGTLFQQGDNTTNRSLLNLAAGGNVELYYQGNQRLTTNSGGINVTGTVECTGLTVNGNGTINGVGTIQSSTGVLILRDNDNGAEGTAQNYIEGRTSDGTARFRVGDTTSNGNVYISNTTNNAIIFQTGSVDRCIVNSSGHFEPSSNNTYDLGTSSNRWRNVYTNDLNLSNEGGANDVDGTWGSWTIQEGEDDLFLLNRRNGKKYKFNLSEVN